MYPLPWNCKSALQIKDMINDSTKVRNFKHFGLTIRTRTLVLLILHTMISDRIQTVFHT